MTKDLETEPIPSFTVGMYPESSTQISPDRRYTTKDSKDRSEPTGVTYLRPFTSLVPSLGDKGSNPSTNPNSTSPTKTPSKTHPSCLCVFRGVATTVTDGHNFDVVVPVPRTLPWWSEKLPGPELRRSRPNLRSDHFFGSEGFKLNRDQVPVFG